MVSIFDVLANGQLEEHSGRAYADLLVTGQGQKLLNHAGGCQSVLVFC